MYWPSSGVDYTERRKTERKKENVSNEHYITGPPQREEILRERKMKRFLNFIKVCHNEFFERITFFISFVVFGAVYRPSPRCWKRLFSIIVSTEEKLIPPFLILYSQPILSKSILKFLMKDGSLICWKISKSMMKLLVSIFLGSAPFTPYCRDIT